MCKKDNNSANEEPMTIKKSVHQEKVNPQKR
jgi:hypothetical protein